MKRFIFSTFCKGKNHICVPVEKQGSVSDKLQDKFDRS